MAVNLSIIVPVFNEAENLTNLYQELSNSLEKLPYNAEIIFINDGSTDNSLAVLQKIQEADSRVIIVDFRRNYGQTAALSAGFDLAKGEYLITLDADLQNDPADIKKLLAKLAEGYDIVSGWRRQRKDRFLSRRLPSQLANALISWLTGVHLHDYGCTLKAYRREISKNLRLYGELHRFIPALAHEFGAKVTEIEVNHRPRLYGQSKYNISRTIRVILDLFTVKLLTQYRSRPMQFFGKFALVSLAASGLLLMVAILMKLKLGLDLTGNPLLMVSFFLGLAALQFVSLGLIGELVIRTYYEGQEKPVYLIKEIYYAPDIKSPLSVKKEVPLNDLEI